MIEFTGEQRAAIDAAVNAVGSGRLEFAIGGLAGTGKSTIARAIMDELGGPDRVAMLTPTGKAAVVLRRKGIASADTIHSFAYRFLREREDERTGLAVPEFMSRDEPTREASWIIVDEASMVDEWTANDLRRFGVPIVWIGDHGQLPPVRGDPHIMDEADVRLETIHRQAEGSPIVRLAYALRTGHGFRKFRAPDGDTRVRFLPRSTATEVVAEAIGSNRQQIICGTNIVRHEINRAYRAALGFGSEPIHEGERLICLHTNRDVCLYNGEMFEVLAVESNDGEFVAFRARDEFGRVRGLTAYVPCLGRGRTFADPTPDGADSFDYGYAVTAHKAQGSEFGSVAVVDDWRGNDGPRWRYTAVTRAKDSLLVYR